MRLTFIPKDELEVLAEELCSSYFRTQGKPAAPPMPIDEIVEFDLQLNPPIVDDLHWIADAKKMRKDAILGALDVGEKQIYISESVEDHPGRYRFTLAHEVGHWVLHRHLYYRDRSQTSLFGEKPIPDIVCRSDQSQDPREYQANRFAASLLMPRRMLLSTMTEVSKSHGILPEELLTDSQVRLLTDTIANVANLYEVSKQAAGIRLRELIGQPMNAVSMFSRRELLTLTK